MTGLLVSVRGPAEARAALAGGADLIDVKEPLRGALGPSSPDVWTEVISTIDGQRPVSAALGELLFDRVFETARHTGGLQYAKMGLAGCSGVSNWPDRWAGALARLPGDVAPVAVAYADWRSCQAPEPEDVLRQAVRFGCGGWLLDTYRKSKGRLGDYLNLSELSRLVEAARAGRMTVVLGGSLGADSLPSVLPLKPDLIAVRGAVCRRGRAGPLDELLVRSLADLIAEQAQIAVFADNSRQLLDICDAGFNT